MPTFTVYCSFYCSFSDDDGGGEFWHWTFVCRHPVKFPEEFLLFDTSSEPDVKNVVWVGTDAGALRAYDYLLERDWEPSSVDLEFKAMLSGEFPVRALNHYDYPLTERASCTPSIDTTSSGPASE